MKEEKTYEMKNIESVVFKPENGEEIVLLANSKPVDSSKLPQDVNQED